MYPSISDLVMVMVAVNFTVRHTKTEKIYRAKTFVPNM